MCFLYKLFSFSITQSLLLNKAQFKRYLIPVTALENLPLSIIEMHPILIKLVMLNEKNL